MVDPPRTTEQDARVPRQRLKAVYRAAVTGLTRSFDVHLPKCPYRAMGRWALADAGEHHDTFAQIFGIKQLVSMTTLLLDSVGTVEETWNRLLPFSAVINAWLTHEVVSDNLAIGLGFPAELDTPPMKARRALIYRFNAEMQRVLDEGSPRTSRARRAVAEVFSRYDTEVSIFAHMLAPEKYRALAGDFATHHGTTVEDIERCVSAALCANILSCADTVVAIEPSPLRQLVRRWIGDRYASVTHLMQSEPLSPEELLEHGTRTILVVPTLGFYCHALAHASGQAPRMTSELVFGPLEQALRSAAARVRLLNDLGTPLLLCSRDERHELLHGLHVHACGPGGGGAGVPLLGEVLADVLADVELPSMTRLAKDASYGEINLGFHGLGHRTLAEGTWRAFVDRFDYYADRYRQLRDDAKRSLETLAEELDDERYGRMIETFVQFHEHIYRRHYHSDTGEYAI